MLLREHIDVMAMCCRSNIMAMCCRSNITSVIFQIQIQIYENRSPEAKNHNLQQTKNIKIEYNRQQDNFDNVTSTNMLISNCLVVSFNSCSKDVVLPKTPATTRRRKLAPAKRSRTLRSTTAAHRESVDSGVELEMTKKSRAHLDIVTEKEADEEQTVTFAKTANRDSQPTSGKTLEESRRKTEENKENIGTNVTSVVKEADSDKECDRSQQQTVTRETSDGFSSPTSTTSSQVLMSSSLLCFSLRF